MLFKDGRRYVGSWKANKMHGYGELTYPDGSQYKGSNPFKYISGDFVKGKREGDGQLEQSNGISYKGQW